MAYLDLVLRWGWALQFYQEDVGPPVHRVPDLELVLVVHGQDLALQRLREPGEP